MKGVSFCFVTFKAKQKPTLSKMAPPRIVTDDLLPLFFRALTEATRREDLPPDMGLARLIFEEMSEVKISLATAYLTLARAKKEERERSTYISEQSVVRVRC